MIGEMGLAEVRRTVPHGIPASRPVRARARGLEARAGEIVGVAAIEGNGQRELLRSLAGLLPPVEDQMVDQPVGFLPEDRSIEGLVPRFTLIENLVLGLPDDERWRRGPWIRWSRAEARTGELIQEYDVRAAGPKAAARTLSGGNQQKFLFGRTVEQHPAVVIAENPTRGLDIQATRFVHQRLRALADSDVAVIVHSSDLDEVLELADRVFVVRKGVVFEAPPGADRVEIGALMLVGAA
jgi:simple sugar transport system ATP-binding protein